MRGGMTLGGATFPIRGLRVRIPFAAPRFLCALGCLRRAPCQMRPRSPLLPLGSVRLTSEAASQGRQAPSLRQKPMLLVWGMKDPLFGKQRFLTRWKRDFPAAELLTLPGANHFIQEDGVGWASRI